MDLGSTHVLLDWKVLIIVFQIHCISLDIWVYEAYVWICTQELDSFFDSLKGAY